MNKYFEEATQALTGLEDAIAKKKRVREILCNHLPFHEQCTENQWDQLSARCWIYATPHPEEYLEQIAKRSQTHPNLISAESDASTEIECWIEHIRENGDYFEFSSDDLPKAAKKEPLWQYITRLEKMAAAGDLTSKPEHRALHSFLHFLRQEYFDDEIAFLEQILPAKHDVFHGVIRRLITPQERPLSVEIAGAILKKLAHKIIRGRPNARRNCLEALALCWMCLGVARLRLPARLEDLHGTPISALQQHEGIFKLPTYFGWQSIVLTEHSYRYISAICAESYAHGSQMILKGQLPALRRTLSDIVQEIDPKGKLGKITFRSFLISPHYAGRWRR